VTVRRAPSPQAAAMSRPENLDLRTEAFINKGMQAQTSESPKLAGSAKATKVLLTIPADSHSRIEAVLAERRVRIPRHTWLLEAIVEKLEREEPKPM
jgi:hypothetical protein